jgi:hypothetical protein
MSDLESMLERNKDFAARQSAAGQNANSKQYLRSLNGALSRKPSDRGYIRSKSLQASREATPATVWDGARNDLLLVVDVRF